MAIYRDMDQEAVDRGYNARATVENVDVFLAEYASRSAVAREKAAPEMTGGLRRRYDVNWSLFHIIQYCRLCCHSGCPSHFWGSFFNLKLRRA